MPLSVVMISGAADATRGPAPKRPTLAKPNAAVLLAMNARRDGGDSFPDRANVVRVASAKHRTSVIAELHIVTILLWAL